MRHSKQLQRRSERKKKQSIYVVENGLIHKGNLFISILFKAFEKVEGIETKENQKQRSSF
jgi:F0F1-type ATP synthase epsilon subunit